MVARWSFGLRSRLVFLSSSAAHSKSLAPLYEEAARKLRGNPVRLAKVDATVSSGLSSRFGIKGFPTLKFVREGEVRNYNGPRTVAGIMEYAESMSAPAVGVLASAKEFKELADKYPVSIVYFGPQGVERVSNAAADEQRPCSPVAHRGPHTLVGSPSFA